MKATWPNQESRRGGAAAPRFPEGAKGLFACYLTPGLPRRRPRVRSTFHRQRGSAHSAPRPPPARIQPPPSCHQMPARGPPRSIHNPEPRPPQPIHSAPQSPAGTETGRGRRDPQPSGLPPGPPLPGNSNAPREWGGGRMPPRGKGDHRRLVPEHGPTRTRPLAPPWPPAAAWGREAPATARGHRPPPHTPAGRHVRGRRLRGTAGTPREGGVAQPKRARPSRALKPGTHVR